MEAENKLIDVHNAPLVKPNYMLISLQKILVLTVIFFSVIVVVYYTPMPGKINIIYFLYQLCFLNFITNISNF